MKKLHSVLLFAILATALLSTASAQQAQPPTSDSPFDTPRSSKQSAEAAEQFAGKPDFEFTKSITENMESITIDVGLLRTNSPYLLSIHLKNESDRPLEFEKAMRSSSCLSGLPKRIWLEPDQPTEVRARFRSPDLDGKFAEVVTLKDTNSARQLRLEIVGEAEKVVSLEKTRFVTGGLGFKSFETRVSFPFDDMDPTYFTYRPMNFRISGWLVSDIAPDKKSAVLRFNVVTTDHDFDQTMRINVTDVMSNRTLGTIVIFVQSSGKPTARPSTILLTREGESVKGKVAVQLEGFASVRERGKEVVLKGLAKSKLDDETFEFDVNTTLYPSGEDVTLAMVEINDTRLLGNRSQDFELEITFKGDKETLAVPMVLTKSEPRRL